MDPQERRSRPAETGRPASRYATTDTPTVTQTGDAERARDVVDGLRSSSGRRPITGCPCGCASGDRPDPYCARFVRDHAAAYRWSVDSLRMAEGRWIMPAPTALEILYGAADKYAQAADLHRADGGHRAGDMYATAAMVLRDVATALDADAAIRDGRAA